MLGFACFFGSVWLILALGKGLDAYCARARRLEAQRRLERAERQRQLMDRVAKLYEMIPGARSVTALCSCGYWGNRNILGAIQHLNDTHKMSREEIADLLDSLDLDLTVVHPNPDRA